MRMQWYRQRQGKLLAGILVSLAHQLGWPVRYVRAGFVLLCLLSKVGLLALLAYGVLAYILPYQEDVYAERYGTGPRKVKQAQKIKKGWFDS